MKIVNITAILFCLILFIPTTSGQQDTIPAQMEQDTVRKPGMGQGDSDPDKELEFPDILAKPTFESGAGKHHMKVWIMSKMKGMDETEKQTEVTNDGEMKERTHHIMVELSDIVSGKEASDVKIEVLTVSPDDKSSSVRLEKMSDQYGGDLNLDQKGEYEISMNIDVKGEKSSTQFRYRVD